MADRRAPARLVAGALALALAASALARDNDNNDDHGRQREERRDAREQRQTPPEQRNAERRDYQQERAEDPYRLQQREQQFRSLPQEKQERVRQAEQRYRSGLVDFPNVLQTQRTLLSAEDGLASTTTTLAIAHVRLIKALGGGFPGTEDSVQPDSIR